MVQHIRECKLITTDNSDSFCTYNKFQILLEHNFQQSRSVKFYAAKLYVTPKKLNHIISAQTGKSTKRVIQERVLLGIEQLLIGTEMPVKEIGITFGFTDIANFSKFFRHYMNYTPAAFRSSQKLLSANNGLK